MVGPSIASAAAPAANQPDKDMEALGCASVYEPIRKMTYWGDPDFRVFDAVPGDGSTKALGLTESLSFRNHGTGFTESFMPVADRVEHRLALIRDSDDGLPRFQTYAVIDYLSAIFQLGQMGDITDPKPRERPAVSSEEAKAQMREIKYGQGGAQQFCYVSVKTVNDSAVITDQCGVFLDRLWVDTEQFSRSDVKIVPKAEVASSIESTSLGLIRQLQTRWGVCAKSRHPG